MSAGEGRPFPPPPPPPPPPVVAPPSTTAFWGVVRMTLGVGTMATGGVLAVLWKGDGALSWRLRGSFTEGGVMTFVYFLLAAGLVLAAWGSASFLMATASGDRDFKDLLNDALGDDD